MGTRLAVAGVSEPAIDLLLLEEFTVSDEFRRWFVGQIAVMRHEMDNVAAVQRSVIQSTGESDLEVTSVDHEGQVWRLLIENKISVSFHMRAGFPDLDGIVNHETDA